MERDFDASGGASLVEYEPVYGLPRHAVDEWLEENPKLREDYQVQEWLIRNPPLYLQTESARREQFLSDV